MIKAVLDTNVFVSALISYGKPRMLIRKAIEKEILLFTSREILEELVAVLRRPKFGMEEDEIHKAVIGIVQISEPATVSSKLNDIKEDQADNVILNTAYDSGADYIVSGDRHIPKH